MAFARTLAAAIALLFLAPVDSPTQAHAAPVPLPPGPIPRGPSTSRPIVRLDALPAGWSVLVDRASLYGGTAAELAVDANDDLYVAENDNNKHPRILRVSPDGRKSVLVPAGTLGAAAGLALDPRGNLYVADGYGNGRVGTAPKDKVWKVSPDGNATALVESVRNPTGVALDSKGNLYVASFADNAVYQYSPQGKLLRKLAGGFDGNPYGLAVNREDNVFVAAFAAGGDSFGNSIYKVAPAGKSEVFAGPKAPGPEAGRGPGPHSLTFDPSGNLWVSYYCASALVRIAPDGSTRRFTEGFRKVGAPNGLAFDGKGNLYVAVNGGIATHGPAIVKITAEALAGKADGVSSAPSTSPAGGSVLARLIPAPKELPAGVHLLDVEGELRKKLHMETNPYVSDKREFVEALAKARAFGKGEVDPAAVQEAMFAMYREAEEICLFAFLFKDAEAAGQLKEVLSRKTAKGTHFVVQNGAVVALLWHSDPVGGGAWNGLKAFLTRAIEAVGKEAKPPPATRAASPGPVDRPGG